METFFNYDIVATKGDVSKIVVSFFAPDIESAQKIARAYVKTVCAKKLDNNLSKEMFKLHSLKN